MAKSGPKPTLQADDILVICELVAEGQTIRQIAKKFKVSAGTILRFCGFPENVDHYSRARDAAADLFESDIMMVAEASTAETAASDRVRIDALKWIAARRSPKKYGDRMALDHQGMPMVIVRDLSGRGDGSTDN